jgi:phosphoglycolate phosphatase-like HAD superfamily hydrolase
MIRLVLFDIDGTLIRTGGAGVKAFERTFALEFGVREATRGIEFAGRTDWSLVRQCFGRHGISATAENFQRFFAAYVFLLEQLLAQSSGTACAGVGEFIAELQRLPQAPVVGLLTGNIRLGAEIKLRHYGLWDHFACGAFGDDHEDRNQLAAIARQRGEELLGAELLGREILVVGDTPLDVACAKAIQAQVLAVGTGGYSCAELSACAPTWTVESLLNFSVRMFHSGPTASTTPTGIRGAGTAGGLSGTRAV